MEGEAIIIFDALKSEAEDLVHMFSGRPISDFEDVIKTLDRNQSEKLWDALKELLIRISTSQSIIEHGDKVSEKVFQRVVEFAFFTITQKECIIPKSLYELTLLLHGYALTLENETIKDKVSHLCEIWWLNDIEGKESLISMPLTFLMDNCLKTNPILKFVKRLFKVKDGLRVLDDTDEKFVDRILNLFCNPRLLKIPQAQKLLSFILSHKENLIQRIYSVIKFCIPKSSPGVVETYADIISSAWTRADDENVKMRIESVMQDIMYSFIHLPRGKPHSLNFLLSRLLSKIHSKRCVSDDFNNLLAKLYQPFLWRSLKASNSDIRANAAQVFFEVFYLINTQQPKQECEDELQRQFDLIFDLMEDEDWIVRQISTEGVFRILSAYWEHIPSEVISDILSFLLQKLVWDQSSSEIRASVIQGFITLLDNPDSYSTLGPLLPSLSDLLHDKVEKVRLTFCDLLLKIKHIKAFKLWTVIDKEHLFARLEVDGPSMCIKLVELVYKSFIDDSIENHKQLERCIYLIDSGLLRTRKFFRYVVPHINLQQAVKYMLLLRKCIIRCVMKYKKEKENQKPSLCITLANMTAKNGTQIDDTTLKNRTETILHSSVFVNNFTLIDNRLQQTETKDVFTENEEELSVSNLNLMRGFFDIICILWTGFQKELNMKGNDELRAALYEKFQKALPEFLSVFEDDEIHTSLVHISGLLPGFKASMLQRNMRRRLQSMPRTSLSAQQCKNLISCLIQSGCWKDLLSQMQHWLMNMSRFPKDANRRLRDEDVSIAEDELNSFINVMNCILSHSSYQQIFLKDYIEEAVAIRDHLMVIQEMMSKYLLDGQGPKFRLDTLLSLASIYYKLWFLTDQKENPRMTSLVSDLCSLLQSHSTEKKTRHMETDHVLQKNKSRLLINPEFFEVSTDDTSVAEGASDSFVDLILQVLVNYSIFYKPSQCFLKAIERMYDCCNTLVTIDNIELLCELLKQISVSLSNSKLPELLDSFLASVKLFVHHCCVCTVGTDFSVKLKMPWICLLESFDVQSRSFLSSVVDEMILCFLETIRNDQLTEASKSIIEYTCSASPVLTMFIGHHLKLRLDAAEELSTPELKESIKLLMQYTEKSL